MLSIKGLSSLQIPLAENRIGNGLVQYRILHNERRFAVLPQEVAYFDFDREAAAREGLNLEQVEFLEFRA